ncbi:saccharopine dehydrogenase [Elysia marginata]|uniref:Saccharopine dehydrogenase n=1 Tax=Elysia marginata TaxID=1093978 RepID=A0AAV4JZ91_9GAST|nr:saccharopine dehydrogenase [Elysia marginata]
MKDDKQNIEEVLTNAKPPVRDDIVYVYAVAEGMQNGKMAREEFYKAYTPKMIDGKEWRAISWTTAASIVAVVNMVAEGKIPNKEFVKQEDISLDAFLSTPTGEFFV